MAADPFDDRMVLVFRKPIVVGDATFDKVTLTEPNGKQLMEVEGISGDWATMIKLISVVGPLPMSVAEQIKQRDLARAAEFFARFAPAGEDESSDTASASTSSPAT